MDLRNGKLTLSPSDVTAFLACEHLTTLQLRVASGALEKPGVENEQAELVFRKGLEHEQAYLDRLRAAGKTVAEISLEPDLDWERAQRETLEAMRAGVDVVYQGVFVDGDWRGVADFLLRVETPSDARRLELRGARHQARAAREARLHPPALLLRRAARSAAGTRAGADPRPARVGRAGELPAAKSSPPTTGACGRGSLEFVERRSRHRSVPERALRHLRVQAGLRRVVGRGRPSLPRRRDQSAPDREARRRRDHDARRARARARASRRPRA